MYLNDAPADYLVIKIKFKIKSQQSSTLYLDSTLKLHQYYYCTDSHKTTLIDNK